jgi:hypothetical protein
MPMRWRWPREAVAHRGVDAAAFHDAGDVGLHLARRDDVVHARRLADQGGDAHARVEGGIGVLKDHLPGEAAAGCGLPAVAHLARGRRHKACRHAAQRGLAAA